MTEAPGDANQTQHLRTTFMGARLVTPLGSAADSCQEVESD